MTTVSEFMSDYKKRWPDRIIEKHVIAIEAEDFTPVAGGAYQASLRSPFKMHSVLIGADAGGTGLRFQSGNRVLTPRTLGIPPGRDSGIVAPNARIRLEATSPRYVRVILGIDRPRRPDESDDCVCLSKPHDD